jgi:ArsR family transcriptional regulator
MDCMATGSPSVSDELLLRIADRLKALADPMRLRLLHALEQEELCVGDLVGRVGGSQANVSKHLAHLRRAGLVRARRVGMNVFYSIGDPVVFRVCRLVCDSLGREAGRQAAELEGAVYLAGGRHRA